MGLFGRKPDSDERKLAERSPETQAEIERWFGYLRGELDQRPTMTFQTIMSMTAAEKYESQRLSALRDSSEDAR